MPNNPSKTANILKIDKLTTIALGITRSVMENKRGNWKVELTRKRSI